MSQKLKTTTKDAQWHPKYFGVVVGLFCGLYMITAAMAPKIAMFGPFAISAGIMVFPLCCIITDLLTEVYGFNRTRQAVWTVFVCTILFSVFMVAAIYLPPAAFWPYQDGFAGIFSMSPRIALGGCLAWLTGEFLNSYVMSKMKIWQNAQHPAFRFIGSTVVGQFADTIVFSVVAFAGTMPWTTFGSMILTAWILKIVYEIIALPLSLWVTKKVKQLEGVEHFDKQEISLI